VDAIAVEVVVEATSACADRARAQSALANALANARAPKRGPTGAAWQVRVGVDDTGATKTATARIVDDRGSLVAERSVSDRTACTPLARAIGAWASLVLDDELARARDAADAPLRSASASASVNTNATPMNAPSEGRDGRPPILESVDGSTAKDVDAVPAQTEDGRTFEVGLSGYVRDGLAADSGFAGGSAFVAFEVAKGWFVRPAVSYGTSTVQVALGEGHRSSFTHVGLRGDFCRRIPGNYIERRGLELDLCLGSDTSRVWGTGPDSEDLSAMRESVGPSAALRGELGGSANLELRLASGVNFIRDALLHEEPAPMIYGQAEVGVSWRFR
jgi:hypothetical protein